MARKPTLQEIFVDHFDGVMSSDRLSAPQIKAAHAIMRCRSEALGGHEQRCPEGHYSRIQHHSCKHRSCPCCAERAKQRWLEQERGRLLPCDHFHVIFTVPHELLELWRYNRRVFAACLFDASRDTLLQLLGQDRHLGATPGIVLALHTWGRTLSPHPHVHALVTAGGLTSRGQWREVRGDYLVPAAVIKAVYRGILLSRLNEALEAGRLRAPAGQDDRSVRRTFAAAAAKGWNVRIQSRYGHGKGVALYLSRYVAGGPIANTRALSVKDGHVRFRYRDHRDGKQKTRRLAAGEFIRQLLWHVPEPGQHLVRHVGLYAHAARRKRAQCREQLGATVPELPAGAVAISWKEYLVSIGKADLVCCPQCGRELVEGQAIPPRPGWKQNSNRRRSTGAAMREAGAQPVVEPAPLEPSLSHRDLATPVGASLFLAARGPVN